MGREERSALLQWVTNQCYSSNVMSAQQCFHALSNVLAYKLVCID